jgi:hypothetical protein
MARCSRERRRCQQWMAAASERPAVAAAQMAWVTRWVRSDMTCGRLRAVCELRNKRAAGRARSQSAQRNFRFV